MSSLSPARRHWVDSLQRVALPVFSHLASGTLQANLPSAPTERPERRQFSGLEAFGRTLAGIAPWLAAKSLDEGEAAAQAQLLSFVQASADRATDPASPDLLNFNREHQPLVDASFLALGLVRSRRVVWDRLDRRVQRNVIDRLRETRRIKPPFNNWLLFAAMIEAFFYSIGEEWDAMRIDYALRQHEQWYQGDGNYGDGPFHHWDYYNSFVIQPYLVEVLQLVAEVSEDWRKFQGPVLARARRFAAIQERMIASDGTFPPLGRSLTYRFGAFHHLALMALRDELPEGVTPAQVRCVLTAVHDRTLLTPGTFSAQGWLTLGLAGKQPSLGESYIGTGSVYLAACGYLPLGLPPSHPFWAAPDEPWTAKKIWAGQDLPADHCLDDRSHGTVL